MSGDECFTGLFAAQPDDHFNVGGPGQRFAPVSIDRCREPATLFVVIVDMYLAFAGPAEGLSGYFKAAELIDCTRGGCFLLDGAPMDYSQSQSSQSP